MNMKKIWLLILLVLFVSACRDYSGEPISNQQLQQRINRNEAPLILDVRSSEEYGNGFIAGALHIPVQTLSAELDKIGNNKQTELVIYCHSGKRAKKASGILADAGFTEVRELTGHYQGWKQAGLPLLSLKD